MLNELAVDSRMLQKIRRIEIDELGRATDNLKWLRVQRRSYFFITIKKGVEAIVNLASGLSWRKNNRRRILAETDRKIDQSRNGRSIDRPFLDKSIGYRKHLTALS